MKKSHQSSLKARKFCCTWSWGWSRDYTKPTSHVEVKMGMCWRRSTRWWVCRKKFCVDILAVSEDHCLRRWSWFHFHGMLMLQVSTSKACWTLQLLQMISGVSTIKGILDYFSQISSLLHWSDSSDTTTDSWWAADLAFEEMGCLLWIKAVIESDTRNVLPLPILLVVQQMPFEPKWAMTVS